MRYLIAIVAFFMLASCAVKKRTYRDGYYVDWAFHKKDRSQKIKQEFPKNASVAKGSELSDPFIVSSCSNLKALEFISNSKANTLLLTDSCGDIITFKSGDQVRARVTEITEDKIKYKRCDNLDGPQFVVSKATVQSIKYTNGVLETIEAPPDHKTPDATTNTINNGYPKTFSVPKKVHPKAWWALAAVLGLFWLFGVGFIIGFVLATYAIKGIKSQPDKWKGMGLAKFLQIFCIIIIGLVALGLLLG